MSYKFKHHLIHTFIFCGFWLFDNYTVINLTQKVTDTKILINNFWNTQGGYNNSVFRVGIVITIMFGISFLSYFKTPNSHNIVRYGRKQFMNFESKQVLLFAFLFSLEYWAVSEVFILLFTDFSLLIEYRFFLCSVLYFFTRFLYFAIFAALLLLTRVAFNFQKFYAFVAIIILLACNSLPYLMLDKGIILYADFINDWMLYGTFDPLEYVRNSLICIIGTIVLLLIAKMLFLKKDLLLDEKEKN